MNSDSRCTALRASYFLPRNSNRDYLDFFKKSCGQLLARSGSVVCENEENCDFFQNNGKLRKKWRASLEKGYSEPFTMQTTSTDQVHCTQLCGLHTRTVIQSCSYAPTSEKMPNYAPNFQPPNYANGYAGIIRRCLGRGGGGMCMCVCRGGGMCMCMCVCRGGGYV